MAKPLKKSDNNKRWAKKPTKRKVQTTPQRVYFLIVCEGEKTEPNYFNAFKSELPKGTVKLEVVGKGRDTIHLLDEATKIRDERIKQGRTIDRTWVVFDKDSFLPNKFDKAVYDSQKNGMGAAWSNEAFELWFLLHFQDVGPMDRQSCSEELGRCIGKTYQKNDPGMFTLLKDKMDDAMARARRLVNQSKDIPPHAANPCTRVHELIDELMNPEKVETSD